MATAAGRPCKDAGESQERGACQKFSQSGLISIGTQHGPLMTLLLMMSMYTLTKILIYPMFMNAKITLFRPILLKGLISGALLLVDPWLKRTLYCTEVLAATRWRRLWRPEGL